MRIRTDGDYEYREETIDRAAQFYDRNKTESLMRAAEDVPQLVTAIQDVLERPGLSHEQRVELAEQLSTRHFGFSFEIEDGEIVSTVEAE